MAGAYLNRDKLFPCTIGDGGLGEPYVLSAMKHFHTAYPEVTNFLPVLVWNGYSQEHHAMVSLMDNAAMTALWRAHDFERVILIDAKDYDDADQPGAYVDSTRFGDAARDAFTHAVLTAMRDAADSAMSGNLTVVIIKQLKGAGVHAHGAKSHNLYPGDTADKPSIAEALQRRALSPAQWALVRQNLSRAGGGPAGQVAVTERERPLADIGTLPTTAFPVGEKAVPSSAMAEMVAALGERDAQFIVSNADGTEASAMKVINERLGIRHPTADDLYHQRPTGQVYEPLSEDACAGLAAGIALFGGRSLWLSYESFAINGWPIVQTVGQAMAELRRRTPALVTMFTAGALEQGRNGWTHQRPEIENYIGAQLRNGNVYLLYPSDANMIQAAYAWAVASPTSASASSRASRRCRSTPRRRRPSRPSRTAPRACTNRRGRRAARGLRGHRRHGAAAGVRGQGPARSRGHARAHRRRRQPSAAVPTRRRRLGAQRGAGRRLHGRRGLRGPVRWGRAHRRQRRRQHGAGAGAAAHQGARPRPHRLAARRDHGQPGGDHGL
jgi:phosphoketolase